MDYCSGQQCVRRDSMATDAKYRRIHVVLPVEMIDAIDAQVGPGKRSRFLLEVVEERLRRERLSAALDAMAGSLAGVDIPGWETRESAAAWVRAQRRGEPPFPIGIDIDDHAP
jgi:hypothetical protein